MSADLVVRHPLMSDALDMYRLIYQSPGLDANSSYLYALLCRDFARTSAVATEGDTLVGVLTGYIRPGSPNTYFAWQTAIAPEATRADIAVRMYDLVLADAVDGAIEALEMSVDASNRAIKLLISRLAKRYDATRSSEPLFSSEDLGGGHYPEILHVLNLRH
ncbi:GNAT family N-acetyltransferase [Nocardia sp. NPDC058114]|uniref:GNAT family N-acetyltransferase n=1 Tax=Nocardia sp. NPDC058114 TaxID=3346346 RepID=UPI0036DB3D33